MTAVTTTPVMLESAVVLDPPGRSPMPKGASSPQSSLKEKRDMAKLRDNAVTMQLTKTKMCAFFERGKCASTNCRYAHSAMELRSPPNLQKTKLCRAFLSSGCNDENCFYAHGETDLRVTEGIYKTQICNFFERGYCKKGDRCNHAHGLHDLRASAPDAQTPAGKTSPTSQGDASTRSRRSPLPLSELLVADSEANVQLSPNFSTMPATPMSPLNFSNIPPTPTKSITELAHMAFSPVHASPAMWGQYAMHPMSPVGHMGAMSDVMWPPRDAVDMLVQDPHHVRSPTNLMYEMAMVSGAENVGYGYGMQDAFTPVKSHPLDHSLLSMGEPSPLHRPAPGLLEPSYTVTPAAAAGYSLSPPGLGFEPIVQSAVKAKDPLMVNLSQRLASLDAVVLGLGNDIAAIKSDPNKRLHRI